MSCAKTAEPIEKPFEGVDSGGPWEPCEWAILGEGTAVFVKYRDYRPCLGLPSMHVRRRCDLLSNYVDH